LNMADAVAANQDLEAASDELLTQLSTLHLGQSASGEEIGREQSQSEAVGTLASVLPEDVDAEVVELFLDEAGELLESLEQGLHQWTVDPAQQGIGDGVKRDLHTFKGGARMAGLTTLGDLSHDFESMVIDLEPRVNKGDEGAIAEIMGYYDRLAADVDACKAAFRNLGRRGDIAPIRDDRADSAAATQAQTEQQVEAVPGEAWKTAEILPFTGTYKGL